MPTASQSGLPLEAGHDSGTVCGLSLRNPRARHRRYVLVILGGVRGGHIRWIDPLGQYDFGDGFGPQVTVEILDSKAYSALIHDGGIGMGRSFADGWWRTDDLTGLLRIALRSLERVQQVGNLWHKLASPLTDLTRADRPQNPIADAADIRAHYDLGNDFFELLLDETLMYSAALFEYPGQDLAGASRAKLAALNNALDLGQDDDVLEIGTGWGGFAEYAARTRGSQVTTTTISPAQFRYAQNRIAEAGLSERVTVLDQDYRDLSGAYDKIVSIEMIEAVDWREYDTFFASCSSLLKPGGRLAMQAILIRDADFERTKDKPDFIKTWIFPGGCLPSEQALTSAVARHGLTLVAQRDIGLHYAETLRHWQANLLAAQREHPEMAPLDDPVFVRLWQFYFSYCEAGFEETDITDKHLVFEQQWA